MNPMSVIWGAAMALFGWLVMYLFGRQFLFNFKTAYPVIKQMQALQEDLISPNAKRYTSVSAVTTGLLLLLVCAGILFIKVLYLKLCFYLGLLICLFMVWGAVGPTNRKMFEAFCASYYRFVPDDALRTAMYNKKISAMKIRLHDMNLDTSFIPSFKENKDN